MSSIVFFFKRKKLRSCILAGVRWQSWKVYGELREPSLVGILIPVGTLRAAMVAGDDLTALNNAKPRKGETVLNSVQVSK